MSRLRIISLCLMICGCSSTKATGPSNGIAGVYVLRTVNGTSLPYVPPRASLTSYKGFTVTPADALLSDQYTVNSDGTYSERMTIRDSRFGATPRAYIETGTWIQNGNDLTLMIVDSPTSSGNMEFLITGNTITTSLRSEEIVTYLYEKT